MAWIVPAVAAVPSRNFISWSSLYAWGVVLALTAVAMGMGRMKTPQRRRLLLAAPLMLLVLSFLQGGLLLYLNQRGLLADTADYLAYATYVAAGLALAMHHRRYPDIASRYSFIVFSWIFLAQSWAYAILVVAGLSDRGFLATGLATISWAVVLFLPDPRGGYRTENEPPGGRPLQFTLRSLMSAVGYVALVLGLSGPMLRRVDDSRRAVLEAQLAGVLQQMEYAALDAMRENGWKPLPTSGEFTTGTAGNCCLRARSIDGTCLRWRQVSPEEALAFWLGASPDPQNFQPWEKKGWDPGYECLLPGTVPLELIDRDCDRWLEYRFAPFPELPAVTFRLTSSGSIEAVEVPNAGPRATRKVYCLNSGNLAHRMADDDGPGAP